MGLARPDPDDGPGCAGRARVPRLPPHAPGQRIGLFGGSFNPPHAGHLHVSLTALRRLGLDAVWWLVTPGNPLKENSGLPSLAERLDAARRIARHPRIHPTDVEAALGVRFTADTLGELVRRAPAVRFVWIMGADNLAALHRWDQWGRIAQLVPIAVIDRPGSTHRAIRARAAQALGPFRIDESDARMLTSLRPPAWVFLHGPRSKLSSTLLRSGAVAGPGK